MNATVSKNELDAYVASALREGPMVLVTQNDDDEYLVQNVAHDLRGGVELVEPSRELGLGTVLTRR